MAHSPLGRTLVIANPAAHSGKGATGAEFARHFLTSYASATKGYEIRLTASMGDAVNIAASAASFDSVLALGGDGVIHEIANGLMKIAPDRRPALGIIPMGSGNDYARTLGMKPNNVEGALAQLVRGHIMPVELGLVNGEYFIETLSFGLDAAIALDTTTRRAHDTSQEGEALFFTSGLKILSAGSKGYACSISFDGEKPLELRELILAFQVGPTYGGGFKICPDASPTDGKLTACYNSKIPSIPRLLTLFLFAKKGRHINSNIIKQRHLDRAVVTFSEPVPVQVDGEELPYADKYEVHVLPKALRVIMP